MDIASLIGLVMCMVLMIIGIITGDQGVAALGNFYDFTSILVTFGGSFMCCLMMTEGIPQYLSNLQSIKLIFKIKKTNEIETIKNIIELSNVSRKEGLLALEEAANNVEDDFLKKGLLLIVDGTDPELVRSIMETEQYAVEERHKTVISFWENLASMGPAWGMIGTLIGLINMLKMLSDISSVGPNMAVALITTFYGSVLANWIATPTATKLKSNSVKEITVRNIMVEGLLSIQAGENPRVIEEKLKSFLSPKERGALDNKEGGEE
ncbi:MAG: motility protein A [Lachnospiraceae bacterium]|nr:motility protein A [Lachnospiraceae bacterium]